MSQEIDKFRAGLNTKEKALFDELLENLRKYEAAFRDSGFLQPDQMAMLAMLMEIHKAIEDLENKIYGLED